MDNSHRTEIDGLRAIAVLSVVLCHLEVWPFLGGYIGVDIFFVISGFLLTGVIHRGLINNTFSFTNFYERRIRRIIPALYFLIFVTSFFVTTLFLPVKTVAYFKSLIASTLNISNIFFYLESGYFDGASSTKPLLHTWSLGVEEQFYIILPFLLFLIHKYSKSHLKKIISTILITSLVFNLIHFIEDVDFTFYLLPARLWELLLGSTLALNMIPPTKKRAINEIESLLGISLICISLISFDQYSNFPGFLVLIPTIGTMLIIHSNLHNKTFMGKILSLSILRPIGLLSYSLYLWHWPVLVFYKEINGIKLEFYDKFYIIGISAILSFISWRFIEQPIRLKSILATRKKLFGSFFISTLALITFSIYVIQNKGLPDRFDENYIKVLNSSLDRNPNSKKCFSQTKKQIALNISLLEKNSFCLANNDFNKNNKKSFLVWGDSHAEASFTLFENLAIKEKAQFFFAGYTGCPPIMNLNLDYNSYVLDCRRFNDLVIKNIKRSGIQNVFLIARWQEYEKLSKGLYKPFLDKTIQILVELNIKVWIIKQAPEYKENIKKIILNNFRTSHRFTDAEKTLINQFGISRKEQELAQKDINIFFNRHLKNISFIDLNEFFCPKDQCFILKDGNLLYRDDNHISNRAANMFSTDLLKDIQLKTNQILFLGDSLIKLGDWSLLLKDPTIPNLAVSGITINELVDSSIIEDIAKNKTVFILVGINDFIKGERIEVIKRDLLLLMDKLKKRQVRANFIALLPSNHKVLNSRVQEIKEFNSYLKEISEMNKFKFINVNKALLDVDKVHIAPKNTYDGIHLTKEGYQAFASELLKYIE